MAERLSFRHALHLNLNGLGSLDDGDNDIPLSELMGAISAATQGLSEDDRANLILQISCFGDYASGSVGLLCNHTETDEEMSARLDREAADRAANARDVAARRLRTARAAEDHDRSEYERLKVKYATKA